MLLLLLLLSALFSVTSSSSPRRARAHERVHRRLCRRSTATADVCNSPPPPIGAGRYRGHWMRSAHRAHRVVGSVPVKAIEWSPAHAFARAGWWRGRLGNSRHSRFGSSSSARVRSSDGGAAIDRYIRWLLAGRGV